MSVRVSATPVYDLLVGINSQGTYPDSGSLGINNKDVYLRRRFQEQQINVSSTGTVLHSIPGGKLNTDGGFLVAKATFTVADNDFSGGAEIVVGEFVLVPGVDFTVGVDANTTAVNIAASISNLPEYSATAPGSGVVSINGKKGPQGLVEPFSVTPLGAVDNFSVVDPVLGFFIQGEPAVGPPGIV